MRLEYKVSISLPNIQEGEGSIHAENKIEATFSRLLAELQMQSAESMRTLVNVDYDLVRRSYDD